MDEKQDSAKDGELSRVPCGLYQTTEELPGRIGAGALVYYHSHGDPGPGIYPVERWEHNKAVFSKKGLLVVEEGFAFSLRPLRPEGFYRIRQPFFCCDKRCRKFERDTLVQLGYNAEAEPLLFVPHWSDGGLELPERGTHIDEARLRHLAPLKLEPRFEAPPDSKKAPPFFLARGPDLVH